MSSIARLLVAAALVAGPLAGTAAAHISIASGPLSAGKSQKITFGVGHGCEVGEAHLDTYRVRILIPAGLTGARPLVSEFGRATVETEADAVTAIVWQKPLEALEAGDTNYYELTIRGRVEAPFSQLLFTVEQTCRDTEGNETTVVWDQPPGATEGNEAAALTVVPARLAGWNQYVVAEGTTIAEAAVPTFFGDAQIVWRGTAAYSANPVIAALIAVTPGVTALTGDLVAGDELWVKY